METTDIESEAEEAPTPMVSNLQYSIFPQVVTTFIVCIASFSCGCVLVWTSPSLPDLEKSKYFGDLSSEEKSWIASAVTLGAVFSGASGLLIDHFGRQRSLVLLAIPHLLGWILIAFAPSVLYMCIGRFVTGFCIGGFILIGTVYLAEISEQRIRGIIMSTTSIALGSGMLLTYILGTFFSWFVITVVDICVSVVLLCCITTIPESPVFLIHKGHKKKAGEALMRLRGATEFHQIENELNEMQSSAFETQQRSPNSSDESGATSNLSLWKKLARPGTLKAIGISFTLMIFQQLCGVNAVIFFTSDIFAAAKTDLPANICAIIIGVDILFAVCLTSFLIDKLGRRILLFISHLGLSICLGAIGTFFYLQWKNDGVTPTGLGWIPLASLMLFMILYNIGIGPLAWFLMSELIPTDVKGPASSAASSFNWLLAFFVTRTFENFKNLIGIYGCFWFFAGICIVGLVFCLLVVPETKGKTLEEIQRQYFTKQPRQNNTEM